MFRMPACHRVQKHLPSRFARHLRPRFVHSNAQVPEFDTPEKIFAACISRELSSPCLVGATLGVIQPSFLVHRNTQTRTCIHIHAAYMQTHVLPCGQSTSAELQHDEKNVIFSSAARNSHLRMISLDRPPPAPTLATESITVLLNCMPLPVIRPPPVPAAAYLRRRRGQPKRARKQRDAHRHAYPCRKPDMKWAQSKVTDCFAQFTSFSLS